VGKCNANAQSAFETCANAYHKGRIAELCTLCLTRSDHVAFHYDPEEVSSAIKDRVTRRTSSAVCSMTFGEDIHSSRFGFADALLDTIVCRNLWGIEGDGEDGLVEAIA